MSAIGPTAKPLASEAGLSLLEVLTVVAILAALSLAASLNVHRIGGPGAVGTADAFGRATLHFRDAAFYAGRHYAFALDAVGWQTLAFDPDTETWRPLDGAQPLARGSWGREVTADLEVEGRAARLEPGAGDGTLLPDILILATGETTPFRLRFRDASGGLAGCVLSAFGALSCQAGP
ncbi:MAG: prepilin-type N-terminal cleavage/methylation domain-containing protein [Pseudomonadota bacterium]